MQYQLCACVPGCRCKPCCMATPTQPTQWGVQPRWQHLTSSLPHSTTQTCAGRRSKAIFFKDRRARLQLLRGWHFTAWPCRVVCPLPLGPLSCSPVACACAMPCQLIVHASGDGCFIPCFAAHVDLLSPALPQQTVKLPTTHHQHSSPTCGQCLSMPHHPYRASTLVGG